MRVNIYNLERTKVILGMLWLQAYNPEINWKTREVKITRCLPLYRRSNRKKKNRRTRKEKKIVTLEEERIVRQAVDNKEDWRREEKVEVDHRKIKKIVPKKFLKWKKIFGKVEPERILTRKVWDHTIDLKKTFKLQKERIYPLSKNKKEEVQSFVDNQLKKGYIRLSKSLQILPVFFVSKKNGSKRMVMDYYNLNDQTVKNNYPFLLIMDLIDNMKSKKVFTKMDLRWRFNNVRIKKGNEWKEVFTIYMGSFEPIVMFFGMTNSLAIFQAIMNKILRDLINKEKVAIFVDNVLVETETKKGYDEIVDEILKRLKENDLYIKLEKCM